MASWKKTGYKKLKYCEACGFAPFILAILQVDHIDGNRHHNSIHNLQTLCANCHIMKTFCLGEHLPRYRSTDHDNW